MAPAVDVTRAMILAAGEGTRLRPLTRETPKVLLTVGGVPLMYYTLAWLSGRVVNRCNVERRRRSPSLNAHHSRQGPEITPHDGSAADVVPNREWRRRVAVPRDGNVPAGASFGCGCTCDRDADDRLLRD